MKFIILGAGPCGLGSAYGDTRGQAESAGKSRQRVGGASPLHGNGYPGTNLRLIYELVSS